MKLVTQRVASFKVLTEMNVHFIDKLSFEKWYHNIQCIKVILYDSGLMFIFLPKI